MADEAPRCGLCVMRNGTDATPRAFCAPYLVRHRIDPPCEFFFTKDQLRMPLYGKPLTPTQQFDRGEDLY